MYCTKVESPRARKAHRCTSCGEEIPPGEKYVRWRSFEDGEACTNKMHQECYGMHEKGSYWVYDLYGHDRPQKPVVDEPTGEGR